MERTDTECSIFYGSDEYKTPSSTPLPPSIPQGQAKGRPSTSLPQAQQNMSQDDEKTIIYRLIQAASKGEIAVFQKLKGKITVSKVADYDKRTPLHLASAEGHLELVKYLLEDWRFDPAAIDRWGNTPYTDAVKGKHDNVVQLLSEKLQPKNKDPVQDYTIIDAAYNGKIENLKRYKREGWNMSVTDYDRRTPLHLAAAEGHLDVVKFLIEECGVDPNVEDRHGQTPYNEAERLSNKAVGDYILQTLINRLKLPANAKSRIKLLPEK